LGPSARLFEEKNRPAIAVIQLLEIHNKELVGAETKVTSVLHRRRQPGIPPRSRLPIVFGPRIGRRNPRRALEFDDLTHRYNAILEALKGAGCRCTLWRAMMVEAMT